MSTFHVIPIGDILDHDTSSKGHCFCVPETVPVKDERGSVVGFSVNHNALFVEPPYTLGLTEEPSE